MKVSTSDRLRYLMESRHLRQADILEMIEPFCKRYNVKIPRNALSQYVTGKVLPKQDKLSILSMAFNVSEAWLMGYDVPEHIETPSQSEENDAGRLELVKLFAALNDENRKRILDLMQAL